MRGREIISIALLLCGGSTATAADTEPICADRPGKATSTCTVPAGRWQIETGLADWALLEDGEDRATGLAIGETTIKYGVTDRSNVEVDVSPWQRVKVSAGGVRESASGFGDISVLYKHWLTSAGAPLQVSVMPYVKAPTARHSIGNGRWEAGLLLPIGYAIPRSSLSLGFTPEIDWVADSDGGGHHPAMAQVAALGWAATDRLNLSAELWGSWDWGPLGTIRQATADGSVAYLLGDDLQLDAGANFGLNRASPDVELYGGVAVRF